MASCTHCGAPLAANTNKCKYCGTRNDVDLHAKFPYKQDSAESSRICPQCDISLQTIRSEMDKNLVLDRCNSCYGIFFDRGELEYTLNNSVSNIHGINLEHIDNINKDRYLKPADFSYRKCPECAVLMNRINFGYRSGVVVDQCTIHGIWLDNGEPTHLMEWKKAGGQLLHEQTETLKKQNLKPSKSIPLPNMTPSNSRGGWGTCEVDIGGEILSALGTLVEKLIFNR